MVYQEGRKFFLNIQRKKFFKKLELHKSSLTPFFKASPTKTKEEV